MAVQAPQAASSRTPHRPCGLQEGGSSEAGLFQGEPTLLSTCKRALISLQGGGPHSRLQALSPAGTPAPGRKGRALLATQVTGGRGTAVAKSNPSTATPLPSQPDGISAQRQPIFPPLCTCPPGCTQRAGCQASPRGKLQTTRTPPAPGLSGPRPASGSLLGHLTQEHSPVPWAGGSQSGPGKLGLSSAPSAVLCSPLPWGSPSLHRQFWRACQPAHQGAGWVRVLGKGGQTPRTASGHCWWLPPRPPSWKRDLRGAGVGGPRPWLEHLERLHPRGPANSLSSEVSAGWVAAPCALDSPRPRQVPPGLSDVTRHRQPTRVGLSSGT